MTDPVTTWIITQLFKAASDPIRKRLGGKLSTLILGDPLQRALVKPTKIALEAAIASALGAPATDEQRKRAYDILEMFWTDDQDVGAGDIHATITQAMQRIVASGINLANAPIEGFTEDYAPTTSLTSLADELDIPPIDADAFAAAFTENWLQAIHFESLKNKDLEQLAVLLAHEKGQLQVVGYGERLSETMLAAVQSLREQLDRIEGDLTAQERYKWFERHIVPAHQLMEEISADYQSGFGETLDALLSGQGLEEAMQRLKVIRRRQITGRRGLDVTAEKLETDRHLFGSSLDAPLIAYIKAAQRFRSADERLYPPRGTWYSHYIEKFAELIEQGRDPHLRSNYPEISSPPDLQRGLIHPMRELVDVTLPRRWRAYMSAYLDLQKAAEARA